MCLLLAHAIARLCNGTAVVASAAVPVAFVKKLRALGTQTAF